MTSKEMYDAAVVGAGSSGMVSALLLSRAGLRVALVGPEPGQDHRTFALMDAPVQMLKRLGVWDACAGQAAPLEKLCIIDETGRALRAPTVTFSAIEIGIEAFAWNIPAADLNAALMERVSEDKAIEVVRDSVETCSQIEDNAEIQLTSGNRLKTRLIVGADGRQSRAREAAGIQSDLWEYPQTAIVLRIRHSRPHGNLSTEFHRPSGPFTLVPLAGNQSAIVLVETPKRAEVLRAMSDAEFTEELERLSHRMLGRITVDGPRGAYPLSVLAPRRFAAGRTALVGEAAHVFPPIGAQGLNLGLRDAAVLSEIIADHNTDPGGLDVIEAYNDARSADIRLRTTAVDLLNRSLLSSFVGFQAGRAAGMALMESLPALRKALMREGMAPAAASLPEIMRRDELLEAVH
ncbi:MAG: UbiH/UbiF family hydroxylase [Pseudomonadota bacterium]